MTSTPRPDAAEWLDQLLRSQAEMMQTFMAGAMNAAGLPPPAPRERAADATPADAVPGMNALLPAGWQDMTSRLAELQQEYFRQVSSWWTPAVTAAVEHGAKHPSLKDRRFASEPWRSDPRFELATRSYLNYSQMLRDAIEASPLDEKTKSQWSFTARQLLDALSPSNFLATNPEALQLVIDTGGQSLVDGMNLLTQDLLKGRITMSDESAFEVGTNLATTAGDVIYENELIQLIRYAPLAAQTHEVPLLIVPPCINKYYILDLQPENSFVRYALSRGMAVYLVSWRSATQAMSQLGWDDYLDEGIGRAMDVCLEDSGSSRFNALGFCVGGTLLACRAALDRQRGLDRIASLTLLTTMLDFADTGDIGVLVTDQSVAHKEALIGHGGVLRGAELSLTFSALRANDLIWPYVVDGYLKGKAPPAFDLLYWNSDLTNLPGPMYCWYVRNTYLENRIRIPHATMQGGVALDLSALDMPVFVYASKEDHIVPWKTAYATAPLVRGDTTFVLGASGHVAGVINPPEKKRRHHWIGGDPRDASPDRWLEDATQVEGSWWPAWGDWLEQYAGPRADARRKLRGRRPAIEPAPGRYVKEKAQ